MERKNGILLTGATGLLGRYLLRDLLVAGNRVAVLVRPDRTRSPEERIREVLEFARTTTNTHLPLPTLILGDLRARGLGVSRADRGWLTRNCDRVLHAAASVAFRRTAIGEPHATNTIATAGLYDLCVSWGIREAHHVSTAFVCGERTGRILESENDCGQSFRNDYEQSKCAAESALREMPELRATVYRPAVIVGDSRTGHTTSYHGVYRFLELANRLAQPSGEPGRRWLPLRLPFEGRERRNFVPVDWVAQAITRIVARPTLHGRAYHLATENPIAVQDIKDVAAEELGIAGVELAGRVPNPSALERAFLDGLQEYWPYLGSDPAFDCRNTRAALPELPAPRVDHELFRRLIQFAINDNWGRGLRGRSLHRSFECGESVERSPDVIGRAPLAPLSVEGSKGAHSEVPPAGRVARCRPQP